MTESCPNKKSWCFVCSSWIKKKTTSCNSQPMTNALHAGLTEYFGVSLDGFNQSWAPQVLCQSCYVGLNEWLKKGTRGLLVKVPTLWSPPEVHIPGSIDSNCFFCQSLPRTCRTDPMPFYDGCVKRPVLRGKEAFPVRVLPDVPMEKDGSSSEEEEATSEDGEDPDWVPEDGLPLPYIGKLDQGMLNFLIQMLRLPKDAGQFLGSFLLNAELLLPGTTINQRNRSEQFEKFFAVQTIAFTEQKKDGSTAEIFREVVFCTDIIGLLQSQGVVHQPDQWLLFMDGSQKSFKCFLLHTEVDKSKRLPSVPILIGNQVPEKYETIKSVLAIINYSSYRWMVLADLKMINIISGLKMAACKFPCFLCRWDSKNTQKHYQPGQFKDWSENERIPGNFSFIKEPLVPADKVVLPELHIKIGIFQVFIKKLFKIHEENPHPAYEHYKEKYSISQEKLQVGALTGPEIRQLVDDQVFAELLQWKGESPESRAWFAFVQLEKLFFGKDERHENFRNLVSDMVGLFQRMGCNMSLKLHFLADHLHRFSEHLGTCSDQHGERGHQEMKESVRLFPTTSTSNVLTERMHQLQKPTAHHRHSKFERSHF